MRNITDEQVLAALPKAENGDPIVPGHFAVVDAERNNKLPAYVSKVSAIGLDNEVYLDEDLISTSFILACFLTADSAELYIEEADVNSFLT